MDKPRQVFDDRPESDRLQDGGALGSDPARRRLRGERARKGVMLSPLSEPAAPATLRDAAWALLNV